MTDRLSIYNDALLIAGERALASLTENREPRHLLDQVWNSGGVNYCLSKGQWYFAMRTVQLDYDVSITPSFGYARAFTKPTDWVITSGLCADEFFRVPLTRYFDEAGYFYAEVDTLYLRYVSNDTNYGNDLARWPEAFREFVAAHFATKIILKITNDETRLQKALAIREKFIKEAKSNCAMAQATQFEAQGSWSRSRQRWSNRRDGGNTSGSLIG